MLKVSQEQVIEEIRSRIKSDFVGLHTDWTDAIINMVNNVEIIADEINSQGKAK
tara:strand:+ start:1137 stop:1298 length:162 start_codon:yes stop_codon:yes gene_type:complete